MRMILLLSVNIMMIILTIVIYVINIQLDIDVNFFKGMYIAINLFFVFSLFYLRKFKLSFLLGLFYISFTVFLSSRVLLDILGVWNLNSIELYYSRISTLDNENVKIMLLLLSLSLLFINLGHLIGVKIYRYSDIVAEKKYQRNLFKISSLLFYLFLSISFIGNLIIAYQVFIYGYGYFVSGEIQRSFLVMKSQAFSLYFLILIHFANPAKSKLRKIYYAYIMYSSTFLFVGHRGSFFINIFLILFLWNSYISEIRIKSFWKYIITFPIIAQFFSFYRSYVGKISLMVFFENFFNSFYRFFIEQGVSVLVLGYAESFKNQLSSIITEQYFYPLLVSIPFSPYKYQSFAVNDNMLSFSQQLSLLIKLDAYRGTYNGIGTSYIAENYIMGGFLLVALINLGLGFLIIYLDHIKSKRHGAFLQILLIPYIMFLPRGETMQLGSVLINGSIKLLLILAVLTIVFGQKIFKKVELE